MKKFSRRGTGWPAAFERPSDRSDPYKRYRAPNSGESSKLTLLGNQGLPGEPPDASASLGGSSKRDINAPEHHPWTDFDPDSPFESGQDRNNGVLPYGDNDVAIDFASPDSPLSRNRRIFSLMSDNRDMKPEQLSGNLAKKRISK